MRCTFARVKGRCARGWPRTCVAPTKRMSASVRHTRAAKPARRSMSARILGAFTNGKVVLQRAPVLAATWDDARESARAGSGRPCALLLRRRDLLGCYRLLLRRCLCLGGRLLRGGRPVGLRARELGEASLHELLDECGGQRLADGEADGALARLVVSQLMGQLGHDGAAHGIVGAVLGAR